MLSKYSICMIIAISLGFCCNASGQSAGADNPLMKNFPVRLVSVMTDSAASTSLAVPAGPQETKKAKKDKNKRRIIASGMFCCSATIAAMIITTRKDNHIDLIEKKDVVYWFSIGLVCGAVTWILTG